MGPQETTPPRDASSNQHKQHHRGHRQKGQRQLDSSSQVLQNTAEAFARTLKDGHYNELKVALFFMLRDFHVNIGFRRGRYDLDVIDSTAEKRFSVEVKWDQRSADTNNLYFECRNTRQNKSSGLYGTDAQYWCHVLGSGESALFCGAPLLRREVLARKTRTVRTGGRDSNSEGHLVPLSALLDPPLGRWIELPTVEQFFGEIYRASQ